MSATFHKFNCFVADLGLKVHDLNSDTLNVMLTNVAPVATDDLLEDLTEIDEGFGYSAGGAEVASTAYSQSSGVAKLTGNAVVITASGGSIGPFQYVVLYNLTAAGGPLIGWWDYGSPLTLSSGVPFTVNSSANGNWDSSNPILTVQ
jgi:hypothetical protein